MRSYFPYMGAKTKVMDHLAQILSPLSGETYIEGFLGSGSVFFGKHLAPLNVLNDADPDIMGMHQTVAGHPEEVRAELMKLPVARLQYETLRQLRDGPDWRTMTAVQRAASTIYLYACAFNAKPDWEFAASAGRPSNHKPGQDLSPWAEMLRRATLECLDIQELLERYVLRPNSIRALVYLDPPYTMASKKAHYRRVFDAIDHLLLADKLVEVNERNSAHRRVRIAVSYDDEPLIRALYREDFGWRVGTLSMQYPAGNHAHSTDELLITNFDASIKKEQAA